MNYETSPAKTIGMTKQEIRQFKNELIHISYRVKYNEGTKSIIYDKEATGKRVTYSNQYVVVALGNSIVEIPPIPYDMIISIEKVGGVDK